MAFKSRHQLFIVLYGCKNMPQNYIPAKHAVSGAPNTVQSRGETNGYPGPTPMKLLNLDWNRRLPDLSCLSINIFCSEADLHIETH